LFQAAGGVLGVVVSMKDTAGIAQDVKQEAGSRYFLNSKGAWS